MSPQPLELNDVLARFQAETDAATHETCKQAFLLACEGNLLDANNYAQTALRDSVVRNSPTDQAISCAYLAAVHAIQVSFVEAVRFAEDCFRLFRHMGDNLNAAVARMLLSTIYQMHLDTLSQELVHPLRDGQTRFRDMEDKALSQGKIAEAEKYRRYFLELGEQVRRARWVPAIPHALPLVWLPVIDSIPPDPDTQAAQSVGYMEPVLFVLRSKQDMEREDSPRYDPGQIVDQLYTARPLPSVDSPEPISLKPPRLKPNAPYAAIKVDAESASLAGLDPDDYLLVRSLTSSEKAALLKQAGQNITGVYFRRNADGKVEVVNAVPPRFVGEAELRMFVGQVDAVLRRVP